MQAPIFVKETHGGLLVFQTVEDAESYVEAVDVRNGEYVFFDSGGALLKTDIHARRGVERVSLQAGEERARDPTRLRMLLEDFLTRSGYVKYELDQSTLAQLVSFAELFKTR